MTYLILFILGLLIGAGFLVVLLIGDRKEARLEVQRKALSEQRAQAGQPVEGAWPPPPTRTELPLSASSKPMPPRTDNRKMVRTFFLIRNWAAGVVVLAYIVYSCFPRLGFVGTLLVTVLAAAGTWGGLTFAKKRRQDD